VAGELTLLVVMVGLARGDLLGDLIDAYSLLDVGLIFALAFGIYKKSRAAAVVMFLYYALSKILIMAQTGQPSGLLVTLIFLYYFARAALGTFDYHKTLKAAQAAKR